jgi:hypothetical protein
VLGGGTLVGFDVASLNTLVTNLNEAFDNCRTSSWAIVNVKAP